VALKSDTRKGHFSNGCKQGSFRAPMRATRNAILTDARNRLLGNGCAQVMEQTPDARNLHAGNPSNRVLSTSASAGVYTTIRSVDHKGVTCYGLRGRGVESRSLMTSAETRDLSGKADRSRVNSNAKRVGKSRHVNGGMFTTVAILNEKSFRSLIEARSLQLHVCRLRWSSLWWWVMRGTQRL